MLNHKRGGTPPPLALGLTLYGPYWVTGGGSSKFPVFFEARCGLYVVMTTPCFKKNWKSQRSLCRTRHIQGTHGPWRDQRDQTKPLERSDPQSPCPQEISGAHSQWRDQRDQIETLERSDPQSPYPQEISDARSQWRDQRDQIETLERSDATPYNNLGSDLSHPV